MGNKQISSSKYEKVYLECIPDYLSKTNMLMTLKRKRMNNVLFQDFFRIITTSKTFFTFPEVNIPNTCFPLEVSRTRKRNRKIHLSLCKVKCFLGSI